MSSNKTKWLEKNYPALLERGVLTEENVEKLRAYFIQTDKEDKFSLQKTIITVLATMGVLLIGLGIILILAKNWEFLSRTDKTVISFVPAILGQILAAWVFIRKYSSDAWKESSSTFLVVALFSTMSLIGQIYNIAGDFKDLLLCWNILVIPIIYLFDATLPCIFYIVGSISWSFMMYNNNVGNVYKLLYFLVLMIPIIPYIWKNFKQNILSNRSVFLGWVLPIVTFIYLCQYAESIGNHFAISIILISFFTTIYALDKYITSESAVWQRPLSIIGFLGIIIISFISSFKYFNKENILNAPLGSNITIIFFLIIIIYLTYSLLRKKRILQEGVFLLAPFVLIISDYANNVIVQTAYILAIGVAFIWKGNENKRIGTLNLGLIIIAVLIIVRFCDSEVGFVAKGVGFILTGIGFLIANYIFSRKNKTGGDLNE